VCVCVCIYIYIHTHTHTTVCVHLVDILKIYQDIVFGIYRHICTVFIYLCLFIFIYLFFVSCDLFTFIHFLLQNS